MSLQLEHKVKDLDSRLECVEALIEAIRDDIKDILAGPKREAFPVDRVKWHRCLEQLGFSNPNLENKHADSDRQQV